MKGGDRLWKQRISAFLSSSNQRPNGSFGVEKPDYHDDFPQYPAGHPLQSYARTRVLNIPELLSMIFEHCMPAEDLPTDNPLSPPRLFTNVCHMWRQVALATPRLWSRLYLVCFPSIPCRMLALRHFTVLTDWFERSGACSIYLRLRYLGSSASDVRNISSILAATLGHAHRWRDVDITAPMPCLKPILQLLGHGTPVMETCRITITSANAPSEQEDLVVDLDNLIAFRLGAIMLDLEGAKELKHLYLKTDALTDIIFTSLPLSLETLSLHNYDVLLGPPGLGLSLRASSLRKLSLHSQIHISLLGQLAEAFPRLEDAYLNIKYGMNSESASNLSFGSIRFPTLQTLTLRAVSLSGTADLHALGVCLDVLQLPVLARLSLSVSCSRQGRWTALSRHLARTRSPLTELIFMGAYFTEGEFLAVLREAPKLERLKMFVRLSDRALTALTLSQCRNSTQEQQVHTQGLCPNLQYLDVPLASPCSPESVINMLLSRRSEQCLSGDNIHENPVVEGYDHTQARHAQLEECRLILSEPGAIELIERHPGVVRCVDQGLVLDLRGF
ncbi:uncharacterized protein FOMMEDRAFT_151246 [Fomitiporia mediterranea MF3/22]|uniref:uncharacterized protein n=1 Tax=Fomitiporia mediterranea (strain MF3/22) TaxID=694068 RepID=UPI0004409520|nr:uncharacterized protein FOMMEDRAFT_151246 [Fomitiporia mediterranea MF3/22]EJD08395.1 hypothetical protein FOMMEDRAFT_151246 [Fomitiporia mediterranea MF3/22]